MSTAPAEENKEKVVGTPERHEFLAETKQLLNIVAKSLYSEKEVFIRELISNASDAIEKLKYEQLSSNVAAESSEEQIPLEIQITANDITNTLTIQVSKSHRIIVFLCRLPTFIISIYVRSSHRTRA